MYNSSYRFGLTLFMFLLVAALVEVFLVPFTSLDWYLSFFTLLISIGMIAVISRSIRKDYEKYRKSAGN
ncbi:MAG: hypothetical protein ACP5T2_04240 [Thermoprotei archaeon]